MAETVKTRTLIIGGGAAGMSAALHLDNPDAILVEMPMSNSFLSPWNIMAKPEDELREQMFKAGKMMANVSVLDRFISRHHETVDELRSLGIEFRKSNIGLAPAYARPGQEVKRFLSRRVAAHGVKVLPGTAKQLLVGEDGRPVGAKVKPLGGPEIEILCDRMILAGGGISSLYGYTTGEKAVNGSVLALAAEAGIMLSNLEFQMFHPFLVVDPRLPRVLVSGDILTKMEFVDGNGKSFLSGKISDALRNNEHHWVFPEMVREFYRQSLKGQIYGHLDCSPEWFARYREENEFGRIFGRYDSEELGQIALHPAFHSLIGGIVIDERARTSLPGVYAAGEITSGLHGANRIGGTSVSEAWVFGKIAAEELNGAIDEAPAAHGAYRPIGSEGVRPEASAMVWNALGPVRNGSRLKEFMKVLSGEDKLSSEEKLLKTITEISLAREASVGAFYREDLPSAETGKSSYVKNGKIEFR